MAKGGRVPGTASFMSVQSFAAHGHNGQRGDLGLPPGQLAQVGAFVR